LTDFLPGADRAALAAGFGDRLRGAGVSLPTTAMADLCEALGVVAPQTVDELYWSMRVTLVRRRPDLETFDRVFDAAFRQAELRLDPHERRPPGVGPQGDPQAPVSAVPGRSGGPEEGGLPWHTLPRTRALAEATNEDEVALPELLPSSLAGHTETPFDEFDAVRLAALGRWLERAAPRWPVRQSRRVRAGRRGGSIALRQTIAASRRAGGEPLLNLRRRRRVERPLSLTLVTDVSASMQSYSAAYLHLMRAFARTGRAETFAFSTTLTRLTPALVHRSAEVALSLAEDRVVDRYGGTHLAGSLGELLHSRHGAVLRGGVLIIASDGWDSDPPEELAAVMVRLRRRARRIVWLNPRAGAPGFEPRVGSMVAALPYCDAFIPGDTVGAIDEVFAAISSPEGRGPSRPRPVRGRSARP
jgi:uncharacterized protein with von Willebrand factor type A (vWA) domain